ncbi:carcinoembryonic antigen-related cell adhesion molecule 4-like isoform X2 [Pleurodeles waltl]|uniref:carcinoembryonic antigen-related cell adhesion molecule 4-like isoform X2 n=1 Tax=Pleurodeles waltl TaxID=8319 RepID=UPI003709499F
MPGIFFSKGSSRCKQSLQGWILMVCLGVCIHRAWAQGAGAEVIDAAVGRSATIPAPVTADIFSFAWYRGTPVAGSQLILNYFVSSSKQLNGPQYTGRESGRPDGSLQITDLRTNYTGNYTVNAIVSGASLVTATRQLRVYGVDYPPPATPCSCPGSCWQTTLGVACGVLLAAAVIIAGMAVHYERCLTRKGTNTDESAFQKHNTLQNLDTQYENMRTGQLGQSTELKHGDQATYEQIKRP